MPNLKTINIDRLALTAQAIENITNRTFETWMTGERPYSSLRGANTKGPIQYPMTYSDTVKLANTWLVESKSSRRAGRAGEMMEEEEALQRHNFIVRSREFLLLLKEMSQSYQTKVTAVTKVIVNHLRFADQFMGFWGSSGPFQSSVSSCLGRQASSPSPMMESDQAGYDSLDTLN